MTHDKPGDPTQAILVVDDSATVCREHRAVLSEAGFTVHEAANGYEALELMLTERFALLVVDINMPVMDGYSFVAAVRRGATQSSVPILMVSSDEVATALPLAYANGANAFLHKPAERGQLTTIARLLVRSAGP